MRALHARWELARALVHAAAPHAPVERAAVEALRPVARQARVLRRSVLARTMSEQAAAPDALVLQPAEPRQ